MLNVCDPRGVTEYIATVKTRSECQLTDYMSSRGENCYGSLLRGSVVPGQVSSGVASHVACGRREIQRVGCGKGWERSTLRIM